MENEESDCRKFESKCREDIKLTRISMREMRVKVQLQQRFRLEKKKRNRAVVKAIGSRERSGPD